ncbi:MAG TPA: hypothetical protein VGH42_11245 [Verrucomicrobiae bacterium]
MERFPGVGACARPDLAVGHRPHQHRANFRYAFSIFEFALIREIRVKVISEPSREVFGFPSPPLDGCPFNLSCVRWSQWIFSRRPCHLGNLKKAMRWLTKAIDMAGKKDIRMMALDDPDFEPLWVNISEI